MLGYGFISEGLPGVHSRSLRRNTLSYLMLIRGIDGSVMHPVTLEC